MTNVLQLLENHGFQPRKVSSSGGGEYHSPCPSCGDHDRPRESDRFQVYPDRQDGRGWYICRQCGKKGDNIQFLIDFEVATYRTACLALGIEPKNNSMPGTSYRLPKTPREDQPSSTKFVPEQKDLPSPLWLEKAEKFTQWCHEQLMADETAIAWLMDRGISKESMIRYRLGYNSGEKGKALYRQREAWGLPSKNNPKTGKNKALWFPTGWNIPLIDVKGRVIQLRIRRRDEDIAEFLPEMKYRVVPGSAVATMVLEQQAKAFVMVENGLDAILVAQECAGLAGAVTTWNAKAKPDAAATAVLENSDCILLAQDYDKAGRESVQWWFDNFHRTKRWPVPAGKDAGEAHGAGVDIRAWILAGLPPSIALFAEDHAPGGTIAPGWCFGEGEAEPEEVAVVGVESGNGEGAGLSVCADFLELVNLMRQSGVRFWLRKGGGMDRLRVSWRDSDQWVTENREKAQRLEDLIFRNEKTVNLLSLMDNGVWDSERVAWFAGMPPLHEGGSASSKQIEQ